MSDGQTFFRSGTGGGAASGDFIKDAFTDFTLPANVNTGLTSTTATNPLSDFFANDDVPRYSTKTLFIKDLVLIRDRTQWINNKPTYRVVWTENCPNVSGYVVGDIRIRNLAQGKTVDVRAIDDFFAIGGVIRKMAWILNPTFQATGTADLVTDGVDTGSDASFGGLAGDSYQNGVNHFHGQLHSVTLASKDIHDYRIVANEVQTLSVCGVTAYFENATTNVDCFPGSTYVDKAKTTTSSVSNLPLPTVVGSLGAKSIVYKTTSAAYAMATTETPYISTIGTGTAGAGLITVTTGQGGSFPVGSGVINASGSSYYIGNVTNQSTDTLTVFPNLGFNMSGTLYRAWTAGPTFPIGATLYTLSRVLDVQELQTIIDPNGFGINSVGNFYYDAPDFRTRIWGRNLLLSYPEGYPSVNLIGGTLSFLQVDGKFSAAEIELAGAGIFNATFSINGVPSWSMNEGVTGVIKKTVFSDAGPGMNSFQITQGTSMGAGIAITKINLYDRALPRSPTLGLLSEFSTNVNPAYRYSHSATMMSQGNWTRMFSDRVNLTGSWVRGLTATAAGGVNYIGSSTNSLMKFQYYGTNFAVVGDVGHSFTLTLDGVSVGATMNTMQTVASLGFHELALSTLGATTIFHAVDYLGPQTGQLRCLEKQTAVENTVTRPSKTYLQADTPRDAQDGDFWAKNEFGQSIWMKAFGRWFRLSLVEESDDPNLGTFIRTHGTSTNAAAGGTQDVETFTFGGVWNTLSADTGGARSFTNSGSSQQGFLHHVIDGLNTSASVAALHRGFNKMVWTALSTATRTAKSSSACAPFIGMLYTSKGTTDGSDANASNASDAWTGFVWTAKNAFAGAYTRSASFTVNNVLSVVGGIDASSSAVSVHETKTTADSVSTATSITVTSRGVGASVNNTMGVTGHWNDGTNSTNTYFWNGSVWSSAVACTYTAQGATEGAMAGLPTRGVVVLNGGYTGSATSSTSQFNGFVWTAQNASSLARAGFPVGSVL